MIEWVSFINKWMSEWVSESVSENVDEFDEWVSGFDEWVLFWVGKWVNFYERGSRFVWVWCVSLMSEWLVLMSEWVSECFV